MLETIGGAVAVATGPAARVPEVDAAGAVDFDRLLLAPYRPAVLRGFVREWPAVEAALASPARAAEYLMTFYSGIPVEAFVGSAIIGGRFFYNPDMVGFNFQRQQAPLGGVLDHLVRTAEEENGPSVYVGAAPLAECLPGFSAENPMTALDGKSAQPRIWIGNRSRVSTHFDMSDNIACVVGGRRRFILFPPEQVSNLYVGPLDHTIAGQPASMVSVDEPDFVRFPRFRDALDNAMIAELEPGDAIYVPALWWHHVDALSGFNILVNYWWNDAPADAGSPFEAMIHALLSISHLPAARRDAWRAMFDNFAFQRDGHPAEHIAPQHQGVLGPSTPQLRARIHQFLLNSLARR